MAEKNIGGIWEKKSKVGMPYLSGSIEINGEKHKFSAFRNKYKKHGNNQPDYTILPAMEFTDGNKPGYPKPETNYQIITSDCKPEPDINGDQELPY